MIAEAPQHGSARPNSKSGSWVPLIWVCSAAACFHLAYWSAGLAPLVLIYLFCLIQLAQVSTGRQAFYFGAVVGLLTIAPQLVCFWTIFGVPAIALWCVLAFWLGLFVALARLALLRFGPVRGAFMLPVLWTGLEFFRSELYYLRFSWLTPGYAFSAGPSAMLHFAGVYGVGFLITSFAAALTLFRSKLFALFGAGLMVFCTLGSTPSWPASSKRTLRVAGVQLEFPTEAEVITALQETLRSEPDADLFMLSEYTFDGSIPEKVKEWCRTNNKYLIAGGKAPAGGAKFYDTAFVVGPGGQIVFGQGKRVPIQFFNDGLPAREQQLWASPWGKIGMCICYDLSYAKVTDRLVELGAEALIVPTMDVTDWGGRQHELHARVAPVRAAEYGVPVFRVASSGISQCVDATGTVTSSAPFPGQRQIVRGQLTLAGPGTLPIDRWLAPACTAVSALLVIWFLAAWGVSTRRYK